MGATERFFSIKIVVTTENDGPVAMRKGLERHEEVMSVAAALRQYSSASVLSALQEAVRETAKDEKVEARIRAERLATAVDHFRPGLYRHTKTGGLYQALFLAFDHERRDPVVVYLALAHGSLNVRPLFREGEDSWSDIVAPGTAPTHIPVERFVRLPDEEQPK